MEENPPDVPRRVDARRNRDRLVAVARAAFIECGADIPLDEVARRAEVGAATVYRHFGDRAGLIRAVVIAHAEEVLAQARTAWVEEPTAWDALRRFVLDAGASGYGAVSPVVGGHVPRDAEVVETIGRASELIGRMVSGAQREGMLRPDVTVGDIRLLLTLITRPLPSAPEHLQQALSLRYLHLVLDGMTTSGADVLPPPALTGAQLDEQFVLHTTRYS